MNEDRKKAEVENRNRVEVVRKNAEENRKKAEEGPLEIERQYVEGMLEDSNSVGYDINPNSAQSLILGLGDIERVEASEEESEEDSEESEDHVNQEVLSIASVVHGYIVIQEENGISDDNTVPVLDDADEQERELVD